MLRNKPRKVSMSKLTQKTIVTLLAAALFGGCATVPVVMYLEPPEAQKGVIAIHATVMYWDTSLDLLPEIIRPIHAYFVKLGDGADMFTQTEIVRGNYTVGDDMYLLNAEPGTYVAIGLHAVREKVHPTYGTRVQYFKEVFFPKKLIEMTKVTVGPDSVAYMGTYTVSNPKSRERGKVLDDAQRHYYKVVAPMAYKESGYMVMDDMGKDGRVFGGMPKGSRRDAEQERRFLKRGMRALRRSLWAPIFQKQLQESEQPR